LGKHTAPEGVVLLGNVVDEVRRDHLLYLPGCCFVRLGIVPVHAVVVLRKVLRARYAVVVMSLEESSVRIRGRSIRAIWGMSKRRDLGAPGETPALGAHGLVMIAIGRVGMHNAGAV
jgi:hypothetical protein